MRLLGAHIANDGALRISPAHRFDASKAAQLGVGTIRRHYQARTQLAAIGQPQSGAGFIEHGRLDDAAFVAHHAVQMSPQPVHHQAVFHDPAQLGAAGVGAIEAQRMFRSALPHPHRCVRTAAPGQHLRPHTQAVEQARSVGGQSIDAQIVASRIVGRRRAAAFQQRHFKTLLRQCQRRRSADRAAADNDDLMPNGIHDARGNPRWPRCCRNTALRNGGASSTATRPQWRACARNGTRLEKVRTIRSVKSLTRPRSRSRRSA